MELAQRVERLEIEHARQLKERDAIIAQQEAVIEKQQTFIEHLQKQVQALKSEIEGLKRKLNKNSDNSNRPPSSDPPQETKAPKSKKKPEQKTKRKRGAQIGHLGAKRARVAEEQLNRIEDYFPDRCNHCATQLPKVFDDEPKRHQVTDLIDFKPHITEHRRHHVTCPKCSKPTCAKPTGLAFQYQLGPRLCAVIALLTGVYHLSRRSAVRLLQDLFGLSVSLGAVSAVEGRVSDALEGAYDEALQKARRAKIKHADGTSWKQARTSMQVWTIATASVTAFKIVVDGSKATLKALFKIFQGTLISDRARALSFWAMERRQVCWAHLLRKFVSFSQRDGPSKFIGVDLLDLTGLLFEYWKAYQEARLEHDELLHWMAPVRKQIEALLLKGVRLGVKGVSGSCADILVHKAALWSFLEQPGVCPTNNLAERQLRSFVLWRKKSFGAQSARGHRFAERIMTVSMSARQQSRRVLDFLVLSYEAWLEGRLGPSLFLAGC